MRGLVGLAVGFPLGWLADRGAAGKVRLLRGACAFGPLPMVLVGAAVLWDSVPMLFGCFVVFALYNQAVSGLLTPLLWPMLNTSVRHQFEAMNHALKLLVEH